MDRFDDASQAEARSRMVRAQLEARDITDRTVLEVMRQVPRHRFVHPSDISAAYSDQPLSIGHGQTISQPYVVASMTQELGLSRSSKVLEVGTGCGYQTAVLAELAARVYSIERIEPLLTAATARLLELGYDNVVAKCGDGSLGWPEEAPFDGIIVTAAAEEVPPALIEQLADPGRLIIPLGPAYATQDLVLIEKRDGRTISKSLYSVRFVPLRTSELD